MKKLLPLFLFALALNAIGLSRGAPAKAAITLAKDQKTTYTIALASDAIPAEKTAAEQLQKYLQQVTGATFPIKSEVQVQANAPQILVGAGSRAKSLLPAQNWSALGTDGIVIKSIGNTLVLAGGRPRGSLYAVFQFLEDEVGCRWWTPTEQSIPTRSTLTVQSQNVAYTPPFSYREHYTLSVREHPEFATILRENGHHQTQKAEWGGHYDMLGFVHTFSKLIPLEKYFKEHPEWYSDPANGFLPCTPNSKMPDPQNTDPDLSNPQVLEEVTKNALAWIQANPDAGYISISQNDNLSSYCRCPKCAALTEAEGSPAGPLLKFVNQVADRIHEQHPSFLVETLAYLYSEEPPKTIRPAKNVIIRLAPIMADFGHPLDSDWNKDARQKMRQWSEIAPQLFVWNYVTNFRANMLPHPNWDGLAKDLRFFADHKVTGIFQQGDSYTNGVGDFVQLRAWLIGKLMWNPKLDQDKLMDEFLRGYYGPGAPYLRQYIDLLQKSFQAQNRTLSTFDNDLSFFSLDTMNQSVRLFEQAAQAVQGDKALADRVRRERLSLELARLYRFHFLNRTAMRENKILLGNPDPAAAMKDLVETARHFGIRNFTEGGSFEAKVPSLLTMFAPEVTLPEFAAKYPKGDVIDLQPGVFALHEQGRLSQIEQDANAAGGIAASIVGSTNEWAIQAQLGQFMEATDIEKWHIYAMVRVDAVPDAAADMTALQSGVYDAKNKIRVSSVNIPLSKVRGEKFQLVDLGAFPLHGGAYIWFAPMDDARVKKVYVERVILIREKA